MKKVLVANRGEIALRVIRALAEEGLSSVAVYSLADEAAPHVSAADEAVYLGDAAPARSYLNGRRILDKALETGADAVHPGYGFLSESPAFAAMCQEAGLVFIGPDEETLRRVADKVRMKEEAQSAGLRVLTGSKAVSTVEEAAAMAEKLGYPVMLKASAGGGGRGMRILRNAAELDITLASARRESSGAFGSDDIFLETCLEQPRHVEVQILTDGAGTVVDLGLRECSLQRRFQKLVEEAPAVGLSQTIAEQLRNGARDLMAAVGYRGAGTVEFLLDADETPYFLEVNPRIQVEHPVTEMVTGIDIVAWQLRIAAGEKIDFDPPAPQGHAIECRICAEDPARGFQPSPGHILFLREPCGPGVRVDSGVAEGYVVPREYDPILLKIICHGSTREKARRRMVKALSDLALAGVETTAGFLLDVVEDPAFIRAELDTGFLSRRFNDWAPGEKLLWEALAAAAMVEEELGQVAEKVDGDRGFAHSPWRRLGRWRLGQNP